MAGKQKHSSLSLVFQTESWPWILDYGCPPSWVWAGVGREVCCPEEGSGLEEGALTVLRGDLLISVHLIWCPFVTAHGWFNGQLIWIR